MTGKLNVWIKPLFIIANLICFFWVFGGRFFDLDGFLFTNAYDGLKNYFNFLYFTSVQESSLLEYHGMNYPFHDYIYYTDSTPIISWLSRMLGLGEHALKIYNLIFLLNFIFAPLLAYKIGEKLNFSKLINVCFAFFVVWMHPMLINLASWTNLSLSIIFLAAIFLFIKINETKTGSKGFYWNLFLVFLLIVLAMTLIKTVLIPAFAFLFLKKERIKSILGMSTVLMSVIVVYALIRITDGIYDLRPTETLGFNSEGWTCHLGDYFKSYNFLDLPAFKEQSDWNLERLTFLGSAFPLIIVLALVVFVLRLKNGTRLSKNEDSKDRIILAILAGTLICYFTSIGNQMNLFVGKIQIFNFLNPLNILAKLTDSAEHFRCMSRFSLPVFTGLTLGSFYLLDRVVKLPFGEWKKWLPVGVILILCLFDTYQMMKFASTDFTNDNYFSEENLRSIPTINEDFDAILPIPYFNVGCEKLGYIIDDNDQWSRFAYQLSLKNKKPLMASKMSRTPVEYSKKLMSLFEPETDSELLERLKGKTILICESLEHKAPEMKDEPALTISKNPKLFIEKWQPEFKGEVKGVNYYIIQF